MEKVSCYNHELRLHTSLSLGVMESYQAVRATLFDTQTAGFDESALLHCAVSVSRHQLMAE